MTTLFTDKPAPPAKKWPNTLDKQMERAKEQAMETEERCFVFLDTFSGQFGACNYDDWVNVAKALGLDRVIQLGFYSPHGNWVDSNNGS